MSNYQTLQHIFLIAMPKLADPLFSQSVVYLWEYNEKGASGVIINKPLDFTLGEVLNQLGIIPKATQANAYPVLQGGPVAKEQGFIIRRSYHAADPEGKSTIGASCAPLTTLNTIEEECRAAS